MSLNHPNWHVLSHGYVRHQGILPPFAEAAITQRLIEEAEFFKPVCTADELSTRLQSLAGACATFARGVLGASGNYVFRDDIESAITSKIRKMPAA